MIGLQPDSLLKVVLPTNHRLLGQGEHQVERQVLETCAPCGTDCSNNSIR
jgi:hypothetical protein